MEILFRPVQTGLINDKYDNSSFLHKHSSHLHVINFDQHGLYGAPFVKYFLAFFHTFTIVWCNYKNALNVMYFPMRYLFYKGRPIGLWSLSNWILIRIQFDKDLRPCWSKLITCKWLECLCKKELLSYLSWIYQTNESIQSGLIKFHRISFFISFFQYPAT